MTLQRHRGRVFDPRIQLQRREVPLAVRLRNGWVATGTLNLENYADLLEILEDGTRESITLTGATIEQPGGAVQVPTQEISKGQIIAAHAP